jgi:hypothetical protein
MSESDTSSGSVPKSDEERNAHFAELMRIEQAQNRPPVSGLAVAALGFAVAFVGLTFVFRVFTLVVGASALVFAVFALPQIRHRERRGFGFVLAALAVLAVGVALIQAVLNQFDELI